MDPKKPTDAGEPTRLGRGRELQPDESAMGRSRGLLQTKGGPGVGRARGFLPPGDNIQGRAVSLPVSEPVVAQARGLLMKPDNLGVGRSRGFLFPAVEPKVVVASSAVLLGLEQQHGHGPSFETPVPAGDIPTLTTEEVWC